MPLHRGFYAPVGAIPEDRLVADLGAAAAEFQRFAGREKESFSKINGRKSTRICGRRLRLMFTLNIRR
jgi:hypothetical protein